MSKIKIFVASAKDAKVCAQKFMDGCNHDNVEFYPWWEYFVAGETLIETLNRAKDEMDAAIIILSPIGVLPTARGETIVPNQNVLFEFGFFYGALGKSNVAVVKYGNPSLPSDLGGYVHITGSSWFKSNAGNAASAETKKGFKKWIENLVSNAIHSSKKP